MVEKHEKVKIGSILKEERSRQGYTREQVAERAEIGVRYLIAIENDEKKPRFDVLYRLVRSLGMSADRIFYPEKKGRDDQDDMRVQRLYRLLGARDQKLLFAVLDTMVDIRNQDSGET